MQVLFYAAKNLMRDCVKSKKKNCIDKDHVCTNKSISNKTRCFLTKKLRIKGHNFRFCRHAQQFFQCEPGPGF